MFFVAVVVHAAAVMAGYPLAASVGRLDVANSSVVERIDLLSWYSRITTDRHDYTNNVSLPMILSELGVLVHRAFILLPLAKLSRKRLSIQIRLIN